MKICSHRTFRHLAVLLEGIGGVLCFGCRALVPLCVFPPCLLMPCCFDDVTCGTVCQTMVLPCCLVDGMKRMDDAFCFLLTFVCFSVMDQLGAARDGDLQQLRVLLTADNVEHANYVNWTALHYSVQGGSIECVKYCIEMGANVNACHDVGWTPLYFATFYRNIDIVCVLLDANAIIDVKTDDGFTPLYMAIKNNCVNVTKLLIDRGAKISNVQFDLYLTAIPDWVLTFTDSIKMSSCCHFAYWYTQIPSHQHHRQQ
jgi:hypothetical protein